MLAYTGKILAVQRWLLAQDTEFELAREAVARGLTNEEMAALVLEQWGAWQAASDPIEAAWVKANLAMKAATSLEEIAGILADLD